MQCDELPGCVDHVIPLKHRGPSSSGNLAWSCFHDNSSKGTDLTGIDPESGLITQHVRSTADSWSEHFDWIGAEIIGCTAAGRTTLYVLNMNAPERVLLRRLLIASGHMRTR